MGTNMALLNYGLKKKQKKMFVNITLGYYDFELFGKMENPVPEMDTK
jgi:hypothetical protein